VAGATLVAPSTGVVSDTAGGTFTAVYASTSASSAQPVAERWTRTRIFEVVSGVKVNTRHASVLFCTTPFGTACHDTPVQYCTVKSNGQPVQVNVGVGSTGADLLSCAAMTSISWIVLAPAKSTCTQSGKTLPVPSLHVPPPP